MTNVNWVKDAEYRETLSAMLNTYFVDLWDSGYEIHIHDPEVSDDQPDEYLRVLDDSPSKDWVEFFRFQTASENHKGFSKKQEDGATLIVINEAYPGATELPPLYLLVKE